MKSVRIHQPHSLIPGVCFRNTLDKKVWIVLRHLHEGEMIPDFPEPILNKTKNKVWARPLKRHKGEPFTKPMIVCFDMLIDPEYVTFHIPVSARECKMVEDNLIDFHPKYARTEITTPPFFDRDEWYRQCSL